MEQASEYKARVRVLVIEDEQSVRDAVAKILKNYGHDAVTAEDGQEGLGLFDSSGGFDIVFTDLSLPGLSGWDVAKAIKERSPDTPVVLLSGWDIENDDEDFKKSGVSRLLPKPVKVKDMIQAIEDLVTKVLEG